MSDIPEWERKYWADRAAKLPHYKPAHELQGGQQNTFQQPARAPAPQNNGGIVDITSALQQRLMQQGIPSVFGQQQPSTISGRVCFVKEGFQAYRMLPTDGFGSTTPLVIPIGPVSGMNGKQFERSELKRCFVVDNTAVNSKVDLSEMSNHPEKFMNLVQVSAPFAGSFLVPESAIVPFNQQSSSNSNKILKG